MAHFETLAQIPGWTIYETRSYLDDPGSPWRAFYVRPLKVKDVLRKRIYMLTWHDDERRLADSSEWRDMNAYNPQLAMWALTQIKLHTL